MRIIEPGTYPDVPAAAYHADPCPAPSLSASIAHKLETQSALHAWAAHPRLNPDHDAGASTEAQEVGTALHALIIEGRDMIDGHPFPDWRTKVAQAARDASRAAGRIPLLEEKAAELWECASSVRKNLAVHEAADAFTDGVPEAVMAWQEETPWGPIWCRSRVDWLGAAFLDDLKTTTGSAHPDTWSKKLLPDGYALQAAFYLRGARALGRRPRAFRFIVAEQKPPYGVTVMQLAPDLMAIAEDAVERAMEAWAWSLRENRWPGYPTRICHAEARSWELAALEDRKVTRKRGYMHSEARVLRTGVPFA
ncbi:PD-(D/E)XK nuclease-like domain-containing protein [Muricoccus vinaceus]|uniref:PD-(D/E)XK nuclease-like domain-containing protein n=1 Tax=Muricoccus vinaceus TaxID=424704 RepID=A0ABV6ILR1_9PROT